MKTAVFWDRDGTLIEDPGYLDNPEGVVLCPGAPEALRRLAEAGYENIITTNQSGVARGLFDEATVQRIHERLADLLASQGAKLDAIYYCPYLEGEEAVVEAYRQASELRKPRPGMLLQAAAERQIELTASWSVGDSLRDAEAGRAAGCRTILVSRDGAEVSTGGAGRAVDFVAGSLIEAAEIILRHTTRQPAGGSPPPGAAAGPDGTQLLQEIQ